MKSVLVSVVVFAAGMIQADLVAHYTFDNPAARYDDVSGNGWNGALGGSGTTFAAGVSGSAMVTTTGSKVNVTNATTGQGELPVNLNDFTVSLWLTDASANWDNWVSFGNDGLFLQKNGSSGGITLYNPGSVAGYASGTLTSTFTPDSTLRHVALTGSTSDGLIRMYVNGVEETSTAWTVNTAMGWFVMGGALNTGARNIGATIDDVQVYNQALSAAGVAFLQANPGATIPEPSSALLVAAGLLGMMLRRR